jgi:hypothetical protein
MADSAPETGPSPASSHQDSSVGQMGTAPGVSAADGPLSEVISSHCRARIYVLDESGPEPTWDARGTGHLSVHRFPNGDARVSVMSETDNTCLMNVVIGKDIEYHLRQSTVITWTDSGIEVGLSFEDSDGCAMVWGEICRAQGKDVTFAPENPDTPAETAVHDENTPRTGDLPRGEASPSSQHSEGSSDSLGSLMPFGPVTLPEPSRGTLLAIHNTIAGCMHMNPVGVAEAVVANNCAFLAKLFAVFEDLEDLGDTESLYGMYLIMKNIVLLNEGRVFHALMDDAMFLPFVGVLEYETVYVRKPSGELRSDSPGGMSTSSPFSEAALLTPSRHRPHNQSHREFLKNNVHLRLPVPITNQDTIIRIHETFRLEYIRDVVLARALDDPIVNSFNHLITCNHSDTLGSLISDTTFMTSLLDVVRNGQRSVDDCRQGCQLPASVATGPSGGYDSVSSSQSTVVAASQASDGGSSVGVVKGCERPPEAAKVSVDDDDDDDLFIGPRLPPAVESTGTQSSADSDVSLSPHWSQRKISGRIVGPTYSQRDALCMLQELCNTVKPLRLPLRQSFFKCLHDKAGPGGFYDILCSLLKDVSQPEAQVVRITDILQCCLQLDTSRFRNYILSQKNYPPAPVTIAVAGHQPPGRASTIAKATIAAAAAPPTTTVSSSASIPVSFAFPRSSSHRAVDGCHIGLIAVDASSPFMQVLLWRLVEDPDIGIQQQAVDLLRGLLDFEGGQVRVCVCRWC